MRAGGLNYLSQQVYDAKLVEAPFPHIYVRDLFTEEHFSADRLGSTSALRGG